MKTFRDTNGQEWAIVVKLRDVARVMDLAGVDLTKILQPDGIVEEQLENPSTHLSMICALLKPQLDAAGITPDDFGDRLDGTVITAIDEAIYEETIEFFPEPKRSMLRAAFRKVKAAERKVAEAAAEKVEAAIQSLDFEQVVRAALAGKGSAGNSPASSASTPAAEPSGNSPGCTSADPSSSGTTPPSSSSSSPT